MDRWVTNRWVGSIIHVSLVNTLDAWVSTFLWMAFIKSLRVLHFSCGTDFLCFVIRLRPPFFIVLCCKWLYRHLVFTLFSSPKQSSIVVVMVPNRMYIFSRRSDLLGPEKWSFKDWEVIFCGRRSDLFGLEKWPFEPGKWPFGAREVTFWSWRGNLSVRTSDL